MTDSVSTLAEKYAPTPFSDAFVILVIIFNFLVTIYIWFMIKELYDYLMSKKEDEDIEKDLELDLQILDSRLSDKKDV